MLTTTTHQSGRALPASRNRDFMPTEPGLEVCGTHLCTDFGNVGPEVFAMD